MVFFANWWTAIVQTNTTCAPPDRELTRARGIHCQNAWIESINGRVRDELLNGELFGSLLEAQVVVEDWRHDYNTRRPHSAIGMAAPAAYAQTQAARWATGTTAPPAPAGRQLLSA